MRVLVATWGNPFQWEPTWYRLECEALGIEDCQSVKLENVSTLPVLMKALKPEKTIVLVLDTLTNITLSNDVKPREIGSYKGAVDDVEERVRWFIENRVKPYLNEKDRALLDGVEIVVLPGVGEFDNVSVDGNVLDFYSAILKVLAEKLPVEDNEVILDLTHGINFMPVLTYRALKNLLGILAYLHDVKLYVVNSEPFPQGEREWKEKIKELSVLTIKLVEPLDLRPKPLYSSIHDRPEWSAFTSSVTNGFPLAFATFYPRRKDVKEYIHGLYSEFLRAIETEMKVDKAGKRKVHIERKKPLTKDFRTAVKLYYMLRVFDPLFVGEMGLPKKESTLEELFRITRELFLKMPRIGIMVEDQLCELKNLQEWVIAELRNKKNRVPKSLLGNKGVIIGKLYQARNQNFASNNRSLNKNVKIRNFIAHSGFEFNTVSARLEDTIRVKGGKAEKVFVFSYRDKQFASQLCIDSLTYRNQGVDC